MDSRNIRTIGFAAAVMVTAGLWLSSRYSYLLFHSLAELFSIVVAAAMFAVAWNARRFSTNGYLSYVGIAFLSVACLDLVHTLAYKGLGVFVGYGADLPTQLWIAARGFESLSLLISPIFLVRRLRPWPTLLAYLAVTGALLVVIFPLNAFPTCYVEGGAHPGLTPFKIVAEYVICGVLLVSVGGLWTGRRRLSPNVFALMTAAICTTILSELAFTRYISVYGDFNMAGHLLKVGSFLLIYKATVEATLKDPYQALFRDLKQHENILQESEQRWATTLASIGDAVIATDVEGKIAFMNAVAESLTGWTLMDAATKPVPEVFTIINEHTHSEVESPVTKVIREGMIVSLANRTILVKKDGTEVPIDDSGAPIRDKDGNTTGVVLVFRDITERKRIEERLRESKARLDLALQSASMGAWHWDLVENRRTFDDQACYLLGIDPARFTGTADEFFGAVHPDDREMLKAALARTIEQDVPYEPEYRAVWPDGSVHYIAARGRLVRHDASNKPERINGLIWDITERKRAEEELLRAKEAWERTFASVPDLIAILDNQYQVLHVNEAMARRLKVKPEEAVGLRCYEVVHGLSEPPDFCPHSRTIKDGRQHIEEVHEDRLGGDFVVSTSPLHNDKGQMIGTVHVAHDITKRKKAENALQKAHNELEIRVEERTAELTLAYQKLEAEMAGRARVEEQLRQAHKMEAVGTLAGGIAHDFNNMLAAIIGNAELAMDDVPEEMAARHNLDQIFKAGMRARGLVRQILTFSHKAEHVHKPLPLTPLVKETFKLLRASLPTTIEMRFNLETLSDVVLADPIQIQQVLMNLCTNAGDAMSHAGGRLDLSLTDTVFSEGEPLPEAGIQLGTYVTLTVSDTGPGMHEDVKSRIFEPFFTTKERGQGTGMGLAVVYGIVKGHRGAITVLSQPGQGATFTVYLPRHTSAEKADEPLSRPIPKGEERILFVDDEEMLVEMAEGMLDRLGYNVLGKIDSVDALRTFAQDPEAFDLVITDYTMPQMTGAALAQKVKEIRPDIPVILCTGYSETMSQEKAESMGIDGFVMKPLSKNELGEAVRRVLDRPKTD